MGKILRVHFWASGNLAGRRHVVGRGFLSSLGTTPVEGRVGENKPECSRRLEETEKYFCSFAAETHNVLQTSHLAGPRVGPSSA